MSWCCDRNADYQACACSSYPPTTPVPASERPTTPAIPRAPRAPSFPQVYVPEVRYDLEHATALGLAYGYPAAEPGPNAAAVYGGLDAAESDALCCARAELCACADRLGRR